MKRKCSFFPQADDHWDIFWPMAVLILAQIKVLSLGWYTRFAFFVVFLVVMALRDIIPAPKRDEALASWTLLAIELVVVVLIHVLSLRQWFWSALCALGILVLAAAFLWQMNKILMKPGDPSSDGDEETSDR